MGRPREFEIDDAISKAAGLFWRNGYEGTSLSELTKAIGIGHRRASISLSATRKVCLKRSLNGTLPNKVELLRRLFASRPRGQSRRISSTGMPTCLRTRFMRRDASL